ncbi:MAG: hypothetical protein EOP49_51780, partial [Sphingobacteriales bacterium]
MKILCLATLLLVFSGINGFSQRSYSNSSVLASGTWYRFPVSTPGVYRIDLNFLNKSGINTNNLASSSFRLFGNGGAMLPENPGSQPADDLVENAVFIEDGGDGVINGNDYILFYAKGPHHWISDPATRQFRHVKNLYAEQAYYYFSFGGSGKRIAAASNAGNPTVDITAFDDHYFHESDTV